jgi:hypothetical protein
MPPLTAQNNLVGIIICIFPTSTASVNFRIIEKEMERCIITGTVSNTYPYVYPVQERILIITPKTAIGTVKIKALLSRQKI